VNCPAYARSVVCAGPARFHIPQDGTESKPTMHSTGERRGGNGPDRQLQLRCPPWAGALTVTALAARIPANRKSHCLISDELAHRDEALSKLMQNHPAW